MSDAWKTVGMREREIKIDSISISLLNCTVCGLVKEKYRENVWCMGITGFILREGKRDC